MKTMLVPIDFSDVTPAVVRVAGDWAVMTGHQIHLFHVMPEEADLVGYESGLQMLPYVPPPENREDSRLMRQYQEELAGRGLSVSTRIVQGSPAVDIIDEAVSLGADVIVMGSHRHGMLHHLLLGTVSGNVLRGSPCPVLIVPALKQENPATAEATVRGTGEQESLSAAPS